MSFQIANYTWPSYGGRTPYSHQRVTVNFLLANKRAFVLNDMGTGKTLSALWACDILLEAAKIKRVLIIGPLSTLRSVWMKEIGLNMPKRMVAIAHGTKAVRLAALKSQAHFVVLNHDGIKILEDEIIDEQFDIIIIDELTAFKTPGSERSKCMQRIAIAQSRSKNKNRIGDGGVWGMTGEITPEAPTEAFMQCKIVNPFNQYLPKFFGQFKDACMYQVIEFLWVAKPEAPQIVSMCTQPSIRYTRDQCLDLPDTSYIELETALSTEQQRYYDTMVKDAYIESDSGEIKAVNAAVKLNKLLQISAGAVKDTEGSIIEIGCEERINALMELFEESPQKKIVVFATFRASIELIHREMTKRKVKCACIHGDVPQTKRGQLIDDFQTGDLQMLILQPQSSAHGITLTTASTIVWFSLVPSNELYQQGNARIVRAGQTRKTFIYMFVSTKAERRIAQILQVKGDLSSEIMRLFAAREL